MEHHIKSQEHEKKQSCICVNDRSFIVPPLSDFDANIVDRFPQQSEDLVVAGIKPNTHVCNEYKYYCVCN